jgi:predicted DNA-binding protein YlxM (UPF0122 family)
MEKTRKNISEELLTAKEKYRDRAELLRNRLDLLSGKDKLLMKMYWENGNSLSQISSLAGSNRRSIARRIHKITERLMEGKYIICLRYRDRFTILELAIAKEYFLLGLSIKTIAGKRNWSYYRVRQILQRIQLVLELVSSGSCKSKLTNNEEKELAIKNGGMVNADI